MPSCQRARSVLTGHSRTSATNGSLIVAFNPLLTAVLSAWWLKERVRPVHFNR